MTNSQLLKLARRMENHLEWVWLIGKTIGESDHPAAKKILAALEENDLLNFWDVPGIVRDAIAATKG